MQRPDTQPDTPTAGHADGRTRRVPQQHMQALLLLPAPASSREAQRIQGTLPGPFLPCSGREALPGAPAASQAPPQTSTISPSHKLQLSGILLGFLLQFSRLQHETEELAFRMGTNGTLTGLTTPQCPGG